MTGVNNQENYVYNVLSNHMSSMDPHDQMRSPHLDYVNYTNCLLPDATISNASDLYPLGQASSQPPCQDSFSSVTGPFDHNSICINGNEPLNTAHYRCME